MNRYSYIIYNKLFFYFYKKGHITFFSYTKSREIVEHKIFILWLRYNTKYIIKLWLESLYKYINEYDNTDTKGILLFPKRLKEISHGSYLRLQIWMGFHPTLNSNPITLEEILKLNPYKHDKKWTLFLNTYLSYYWDNPQRTITKNKLDTMLSDIY